MNHHNLQNIGTFTHQMVDRHIMNQENAHFGQNLTKNGIPTFTSIYLTETKEQSHGATKEYVDMMVNGIQWNKSVKEIFDFTMNITVNMDHNQYDRYISMTDYKNWKKNNIYEYDGKNWIETIPNKGMALFVEDGNIFPKDTIVFNGDEWVKFGSTMNHETLCHAGKYAHTEIDEHINDDTTAHFNQNLTSYGNPTFQTMNITSKVSTKIMETEKCIISENLQIGNFVMPKNDNDFSIVSNTGTNIECVSANDNSNIKSSINLSRAFGDIYSPKRILKDTNIGSISFLGFDGKEYNSTSTIQNISTEDFSELNHGSRIDFYTTENNSDKKMMFQIENDGKINCFCKKNDAFNINGGINVMGNIYINKTLQTQKISFHGEDEFSLITNNTNENLDQKVISVCGGGNNNVNRGGVINISGNDSNLDGTIQIKAGKPNGMIEFSTNNVGIILDKSGNTIVNNIKCLNRMKLPCLTEMPKDNEIGDIYFDVNAEKIKLFTSLGYKTLMFE